MVISDKGNHLRLAYTLAELLLYLGPRACPPSYVLMSPTCLNKPSPDVSYASYFLSFPLTVFANRINTPLTRQPTRLEGLSRTVRNYVPTPISIAVPSASPSPPRVALPVSFGRFMSPAHPSALPDAIGTDHRRSWGSDGGERTLDEVLALDQNQPNQSGAQRSDLPRYPGSDDSENITWAKWDTLRLAGAGSPK